MPKDLSEYFELMLRVAVQHVSSLLLLIAMCRMCWVCNKSLFLCAAECATSRRVLRVFPQMGLSQDAKATMLRDLMLRGLQVGELMLR